MNKEKVVILSKQLYFDLTEEETNSLLEEFTFFEKQMLLIKEIDISDYIPITFPLDSLSKEYKDMKINNLREDVVDKKLGNEILKNNCKYLENNYVKIKKVI